MFYFNREIIQMKKHSVLQVAMVLLSATTLFFTASSCCKKDDTITPPTNTDNCDSIHPVIFLHGFLASGDTWANQVMRFNTNGYCDNLLYAYDWNTLSGGNDVAALDKFIDSVLLWTGATQVDLVGHSAGGGYGYSYCEDTIRARKIAHYVHIGSSSQSSPAGLNDEVPTLNISSPDDKVAGSTSITGATNITLTGTDHYQVATSAETFYDLYKFFNNGKLPTTTTISASGTELKVSGKALTLGDNSPHNNATINIYEVNPSTGYRLNSTPNYVLHSDANGKWGPQTIKSNTKYEFEIISGVSGDRVIHYYREGFTHNNPLVYLRTIPPASSLAGQLLSGLPKNDNQTVLAVFTASQATVAGRDSLTVDNNVLSTSAITPASNTVIAMFLYDDNNNQTTDLSEPFLFTLLTQFLTARDVYFQTTTPASIPLRFNGRELFVPNLKSQSEGIIVTVFD